MQFPTCKKRGSEAQTVDREMPHGALGDIMLGKKCMITGGIVIIGMLSLVSGKDEVPYLLMATRAACGPFFPCSSINVTSVPNFNRPNSSLSTLLR